MKKIYFLAALLVVTQAFARDCEGDFTMVTYSCINPMPGADVRLTIIEHQTCERGEVTKLDRILSVMRFTNTDDRYMGEDKLEITYGPRAHHDPARSVDFLTFEKPLSVVAHDEKSDILMNLSSKLVQIPGLLEKHYPGTFKIVRNEDQKTLYTGKLSCSISR